MLELKNISYVVKNGGEKKTILHNFSYIFKDDCVTAITGQNGSGKSTLTKIIMGIVKPTSGKVLLDGQDISNLSIDERANLGLNYAFQQPIAFKGVTVKDLIDIATGTNNTIPQACTYLSKLGICAKDYINRDFDKTLSGGEQKRIELALALAKRGNTIIFDEPEAGIDLWSFDKLASVFEKGKSFIVVSHQTRLLQHADEIIVLDKGQIKLQGRGSEVLKAMGKQTCAQINGGENETR